MKKKFLNDSIEDKRLRLAYVWFATYMNLYDTINKPNGDIYFHNLGDNFWIVWVRYKEKICMVNWGLWRDLIKEYSLNHSEIEQIVSIWLKNKLGLLDFNVTQS